MQFSKWLVGATVAALVVPSISEAQGKGFQLGYSDIGATIGLGNVGGTVALGGRYERAFKKLPDLGDGTLGIQAGVDYWSYGEEILTASWDIRYITFSGTANYHFKVTNTKFDPFLGAGLGIASASTKVSSGVGTFGGSASDGLYFVGRAGLRYFLNNKAAFYADAGTSRAAFVNVGFTFGLSAAK